MDSAHSMLRVNSEQKEITELRRRLADADAQMLILRDRCHRLEHENSRLLKISGGSLCVMSDFEVEKLRMQLQECGVVLPRKTDNRGLVQNKKTLEDLSREISNHLCLLKFDSEKPTRYIDKLQVRLMVVIGNGTCWLIEKDRFEVARSEKRNIHLPLRKTLRVGTTWSEGVANAIFNQLGFGVEWQRGHLRVDEDSYECLESDAASCDAGSDYPQLLTKQRIHKVNVYIQEPEKLCPELAAIGLPSLSDSVTCEVCDDGRHKMHVWSWASIGASNDHDHIDQMASFQRYLLSGGVDVSLFGSGKMTSLGALFEEVYHKKESTIVDSRTSSSDASEDAELLRIVSEVEVRLVAEVHQQKRILIASEAYLDDGRRRQKDEFVTLKMRAGERWQDTLQRGLAECLGLASAVQEACLQYDEETVNFSVGVRWSTIFPIRTRYNVWSIRINIRDPLNPGLSDLGLPRGISFVSREGTSSSCRLHVWSWSPLHLYESHTSSSATTEHRTFEGTGYEEFYRSLCEAEQLVMQSAQHVELSKLGLEAPLRETLQKIRSSMNKVVNLDAEVDNFDVSKMFVKRSMQDTGIAEFIKTNFTRQASGSLGPRQTSGSLGPHSSSSGSLPWRLPDAREDSCETTSETTCDSANSPPGYSMCEVMLEKRKVIKTRLRDLNLNFFDLDDASLSVLELYGEVVLKPLCTSALHCGMDACARFLQRISGRYHSNPYHNAVHAVEVCHIGIWLARAVNLYQHQTELELIGFILASLCHDVQHFGRTNVFCVNTQHSLALIYNDQKVLENMHAATCFKSVQDPEGTIMDGLNGPSKTALRSLIVGLILSTDMTEHFQMISKARVLKEADFNMDSDADRSFLSHLCIKGGDIGHAFLSWDLHTEWSGRVVQEFFDQGDEERRLGLPCSPLCDRETAGDFGKSQLGFIDFVCTPLFQELADIRHKLKSAGAHAQAAASQSLAPVAATGATIEDGDDRNEVECGCMAPLKANAAKWVEDESAVLRITMRAAKLVTQRHVCAKLAN